MARRSDKRWGTHDDVELVIEDIVEEGPRGRPVTARRPPHRRSRLGSMALVGVLVALATVSLVSVFRTTPPVRDRDGAAPTPGTGRQTGTTAYVLPPVDDGVVRPTMVAPSNLRAELRLVDAAADRSGSGFDPARITVWSASRRQAIEVVGQDGCRPRRDPSPTRAEVAERARARAPADLRWCEDDVEITVVASPSTAGDVVAQIVATVTFGRSRPGDPIRLRSVLAPAEFEVIGDEPSSERVLLRYRAEDGGDEVLVRVQGGDRWSLDRHAARALVDGGWRGRLTAIGSMTGFVVERAWVTTIYFLYASRTVVSITAKGITADEAVAVAASLAEVDPSIAPTVDRDALTWRWTQ